MLASNKEATELMMMMKIILVCFGTPSDTLEAPVTRKKNIILPNYFEKLKIHYIELIFKFGTCYRRRKETD